MKLETLLKEHNTLCREGSEAIKRQNESYRNLEKAVAKEIADQDFSQNLATLEQRELGGYFAGNYNSLEISIPASEDFNEKFKSLADKFYSSIYVKDLTLDLTFIVKGNADNSKFIIKITFKDKMDIVSENYIYGSALTKLTSFCKKNNIKFTSSSKTCLKYIQSRINLLFAAKKLFENSI